MWIAAVACALAAAACGRLDFDPVGANGGVAYVAPVVQRRFTSPSASDAFPLQASTVGNAILVSASCFNPSTAPTASLSAPGWSFAQLDPIRSAVGDTGERYYVETFVAIAPDTSAATASVAWSTVCDTDSDELGDELAGNDPSGGAVTFDAHVVTTGSGECTATLTTGHADDAIWGACYSGNTLTAVGPGFSKGADDKDGDWSEYAFPGAPAGTSETVTFSNESASSFVLEAVAIKPR